MQFSPKEIYEFDVISNYGNNEDFFRLSVPDYGECRLPKLKFQREEALPARIKCRVKYVNNGVPVISHYMPQYVHRFYGQAMMQRRDFDFTVISAPERAGENYVLEDTHGLRYNLRDDGGTPLAAGQTVSCHFTKINATFFNLERSKSDVRLPFISPEQILERTATPGVIRKHVLDALAEAPELAEANEELRHGNPRWILTALQAALDSLPQWFIDTDMRGHHRYLRATVELLRRAALYLIEDSRFLRNQPAAERREIQGRVTAMVEALEPYVHTLRLFRTGGEIRYLEDIMKRLRESGYLYHPAQQFSALMLILRTNPLLVREYLGRIFDTIMEWDLDTWTTEPFRSAFVGQFEIYIRHASRQLAALPQADTPEEKDLLEKIVTAVALQTLIGGNDDPERTRRNRSLLYRSITLLRPDAADTLLDKAFLTINGSRMPLEFNYDHIRQPLMLMTRAAVAPGAQEAVSTVGSYFSGNVAVTVGPDGVSLRRLDEAVDSRAIPAGMFGWNLASPQIYLDNIPALPASKFKNLDAHRRLWSDIERALFEQRTPVAPAEITRRKADPGDDVLIVIDPQEISGGDDPLWRARIDDENFLADEGTISRSDIVDFLLRGIDLDYSRATIRSAFLEDDGRPRHFFAKVTEVKPDGSYRFSLADDVRDQSGTAFDYNESYLAVITQRAGKEYRTISETGYGFYLQADPRDPEYKPGTYVRFRLLDTQNPYHLLGTIVDVDEENKLDKASAFATLMKSISVVAGDGDEAAPAVDEPALPDATDQTIDRDHIRELVEIFRFKALSAAAPLAAYDFLLFARQLALAIGDGDQAEVLRLQASLLRLHQFYATNNRIDADELETYRDKVKGNPLLEIMFHRLEIVSWLGKANYDMRLWDAAHSTRNNLESTLAKLVLAYNMLPAADDSDEDARKLAQGLKNKIAALLGVNFDRTVLKSYGRENQFIEFKSSIVYPARKNKTDKVEADPERQQAVILKIIASFLNSSGGTLYIGVNDFTRSEAGLFEDFEYYKHRKARIGNHYYDMKTADNFCVFLDNLVRATWGNIVAGSVQIRVDDEASRDVIIVEVQPRTVPVKLDDKIFVRRSSSSVTLTEEEQAEFETERAILEQQRVREANAALAAAATTSSSAAALPAKVEPRPEAQEAAPSVPTSLWRSNVLHNYEEGYTAPAGYLYFKSDNTVAFSSQDLYIDTDPDCTLALAISPDEADGGFLLMVFDHQRVLKVPLQEIVEKGENRPAPHFHDEALIFATVARSGDGLFTMLSDSHGNLYRRATPVNEIESAHLNSSPDRIADLPSTTLTEACELIAADRMDYFEGASKGKLSSKQIGHAIKCQKLSPKAAPTIKAELDACAPHA